jgi:hypothetical protein
MAIKPTKTPKPTPSEFRLVKLGDIYVDESWNARSGDWKSDDAYKSLVEALEKDGQIYEPLEIVRSEGFGAKTQKPFTLIAGFRRFSAATALAWKEVPCAVLALTPTMARVRNLQENTQREGFKTADVVWALHELGENATNKEIAVKCNLAQSWVTKLCKIGNDLQASVFEKWRNSSLQIPVKDISRIADAPKDKQEAMWSALIADVTARGPQVKGKWIENAIKRAGVFGHDIGQLVATGLLVCTAVSSESLDLELSKFIGKVPASAKCSDDDKVKILDAFLRGVHTGSDTKEAVQSANEPEEMRGESSL